MRKRSGRAFRLEQDGSITQEETGLLSRVFSLNDLAIQDVMVPLDRITFVDESATLSDLTTIVARSGYSCFPVARSGSQAVIGIIHAKDLLKYVGSAESFKMKQING